MDLIDYQPDYVENLKRLARTIAILHRLVQERDNRDAADNSHAAQILVKKFNAKIHTFLFDASKHVEMIEEQKIFFLTREKPYSTYKQDVELNIAGLEQFYKELQTKAEGAYLPLEFVSTGTGGQISVEKSIQSWVKLLDKAMAEMTYDPTISGSPQLQAGASTKKDLLPLNPRIGIKYADNGLVAPDRYALHWVVKPDGSHLNLKETMQSIVSFSLYPAGFAQADGKGVLSKAPADSEQRDLVAINRETFQFESKWQYGGSKSVSTIIDERIVLYGVDRQLYEREKNSFSQEENLSNYFYPSQYSFYRLASLRYFDTNLKHQFLLYPFEMGPFKTKKLQDLQDYLLTKHIDNSCAEKPLASIIPQGLSDSVELYCTLPELDKRLTDKLIDMELAILRIRLAKLPHQKNLTMLSNIEQTVAIHEKFPYRGYSAEQKSKLTELKDALERLQQGVIARINDPSKEARADFAWLSSAEDELHRHGLELWEMLKSKDFRNELRHYLKDTADKPRENGESPPGPYMVYEPCWEFIFLTIARCYEALSYCEPLVQEVWDKDLQHGFDQLACHPQVEETLDQVKEIWEQVIKGQGYDLEDFINNWQQHQLAEVTPPSGENESLLATMIKYSPLFSGAKAGTDLIVPAPGPPNPLQVAMRFYSKPFCDYLCQRINNDEQCVFHLRLFAGFFRFHNLVPDAASPAVIANQFKMSVAALLVNKNGTKRFPFLNEGMTNLKTYLKSIGQSSNFKEREDAAFRPFQGYVGITGKCCVNMLSIIVNSQALAGALLAQQYEGRDPHLEAAQLAQSFGNTLLSVGNLGSNSTRLVRHSFFRSSAKLKKIIGQLSNHLDDFAHCLYFTGAITSFWQAYNEQERGQDEEALKAMLSGVASLTMAVGYAVEKALLKQAGKAVIAAGSKAAVRQASMAVVVAENPELWLFTETLFLVGTIVNVGLTVLDLPSMLNPIGALLDNDNTRTIQQMWESIKQPLASDPHYQAKYKNLKGAFKDLLFSYPPERDVYRFDLPMLNQVYSTPSFDSYRNKDFIATERTTVEPADTVDTLIYDQVIDFNWHSTDKIIDYSGVKWQKLSWRAVVPLYLCGYTTEQITQLVKMPVGDAAHRRDPITTPENIIDYYLDLAENTRSGEDEKTLQQTREELENGTFCATATVRDSYRWYFPQYKEACQRSGSV